MIKLMFKQDTEMALNDVIKEARLKRNLKQDAAAELVGVTVQTYSKWENGKTEPKASQVAKLSKILGISTNEICNGEESQKLEFTDFMTKISRVSRTISDFEQKMAIWEYIDDDNKFLENLMKHNNAPEDEWIRDEAEFQDAENKEIIENG